LGCRFGGGLYNATMAENPEKKDEEKFEFDSAGQA
jgi:hypothetical protein